jgi:PRTRC genetic system protein E
MFRELAPFLRHRAVLLTVTHLGEDQIRVNVVPKKLKDGENEALTTPLSITGTAEELDADLPKTLVDYVGAHLQLKNSLESAKTQMEIAAKTAQEEARAKAKSNGKSTKPQVTSQSSAKPSAGEEKVVEVPTPAEPKSLGLFDFAAAPESIPAVATPVRPSSGAVVESDEDEILAEVNDNDPDDDYDEGFERAA